MSSLPRLFAWLLAVIVVCLPVAAVLNGWLAPEHWPIRRLHVVAEYQRVSEDQIRTTVASTMGRGYFDADPMAIHAALAALPWVEYVEVRKRWPDRIEVLLVEYRARARWGTDRLLSESGEMFSAPGAADLQGLPHLHGPDEQVADVLAFFDYAQAQLASAGLALEKIQLSPRGSWTMQLKSGANIVLGRSAKPEQRLKRLVRALPEVLQGARHPIERIDLRYTNGLAIVWAGSENRTVSDEPAG